MNEREIGEIRRRVRRDRSNMTSIYGCYVNAQKEIVSEFKQSAGLMPENESEKYFGLLRRVLSGTVGKNLIDITFRTEQVMHAPQHKLLMQLRSTGLQDEEARQALYRKIIESVNLTDNYLILLGCDSYDVPMRGKDGETQQSDETYTYLLCAICPVKEVKGQLSYVPEEKKFHDGGIVHTACAPEAGFLFPSFDDRATNIYNALYYTHSAKDSHDSLVNALFDVQPPKPAEEQKKSFDALLAQSLEDECSMEVVQSVHEQLRLCVEAQKESKLPEPPLISKEEVKSALRQCAVSEKHMAKFSVDFDEAFGTDAQLHPKNLAKTSAFEVTTPDVSIRVAPERSDLIETRIIGGVKYILICADENVEVNGVPICMEKEKQTV